jgi:hypothetical protein
MSDLNETLEPDESEEILLKGPSIELLDAKDIIKTKTYQFPDNTEATLSMEFSTELKMLAGESAEKYNEIYSGVEIAVQYHLTGDRQFILSTAFLLYSTKPRGSVNKDLYYLKAAIEGKHEYTIFGLEKDMSNEEIANIPNIQRQFASFVEFFEQEELVRIEDFKGNGKEDMSLTQNSDGTYNLNVRPVKDDRYNIAFLGNGFRYWAEAIRLNIIADITPEQSNRILGFDNPTSDMLR